MSMKLAAMKVRTYHNVLISLLFILAGIILVVLVNYHMKQQALDDARSKARLILDRHLAIHTYFSHDLKPKLFTLTDPYRSKDYFEPAWMSSTFAVRQIDKYAKSLSRLEYYYKECAINARSPENEADTYERAFIARLNANPELTEQSEMRMLDGRFFFVVLRRGEMLEASCLRCHSAARLAPRNLVRMYGPKRSFKRTLGDVVSAISIRVPLSEAYTKADHFSLLLSGMLLTLLGGLYTMQLWINRRLVYAPLDRLREKAVQISSDERFLGEEIEVPSGKELSELTAAFNTMSVNLRHSREHLEELVAERTIKLQKALDHVKKLSGLLPICSICKKIRDDAGYWNQIEEYIREHSEVEFSHGICPECAQKAYPDYFKRGE